mmetsp:Transcript_31116/g.100261  ORF Transcript_31116/g.100261 Transcript_31116/m.100261 type:complete len:238 (+) Transcript_31116:1183-1896(+)
MGKFSGPRARLLRRPPGHGSRGHRRFICPRRLSSRPRRRSRWSPHRLRLQGPLPHHKSSPRNPRRRPLVPLAAGPDVHGGLPALFGHLHRTPLHLRVGLGPQDLHPLRHPVPRLCDARRRHRVHHGIPRLLPTRPRRLPLVVAITPLRRRHRRLHLRLLLLLLLQPLQHGRHDPGILLLWIHGRHFLRLLSHARRHRLLRLTHLRLTHLLRRQGRLKEWFKGPGPSRSLLARGNRAT